MDYVLANDTIEGAPYVTEEHQNVFDCATNAKNGTRSIHYLGHVRMMASAQPFISGAISKTVNLPESATGEDVMNTYLDAWRTGLKAIAIYRDNSKGSQPLNTSKTKGSNHDQSASAPSEVPRRKLPADVKSIRHKFSIAGHEGYIHCGLYEDGSLGEIFIRVAKEGSTTSGLFDAIGILMSVSLQSGVPVKTIIKKFIHSRFEPMGFTENKDIMTAKSILDYIAKFLAIKFLQKDEQMELGIFTSHDEPSEDIEIKKIPQVQALGEAKFATKSAIFSFQDAPSCRCGGLMVRTGSCYTCPSCGENIGSCS